MKALNENTSGQSLLGELGESRQVKAMPQQACKRSCALVQMKKKSSRLFGAAAVAWHLPLCVPGQAGSLL